jgi:hypothetical protein
VKDLPVLQCDRCSEYFLEYPTLARVEQILASTNKGAELGIVAFAASRADAR